MLSTTGLVALSLAANYYVPYLSGAKLITCLCSKVRFPEFIADLLKT